MNKILPFIFFFLVTRHVGVAAQSTSVYDQLVYVNAEWKNQPDVDISLKSLPATHLMERQLVQQHLSEVEKLLRRRDISHLTFSQQQHRLENLEVLHQYQLAAQFPVNNGHSNRQPYFIDASNNYCAVGYLMKMSGADEMARQISSNENTNYLIDIHHPQMMNWVESSGLNVGELALIQPGYGDEWPACLVEMHYNNVGKDVNEYIEIHQSAGQLLGMRDFTEIHFFDYPIGNVPYKVVNISQMTLCTTSNISEKFYGYKFPSNEDFADSGRVVLLATGWRTDTIAVYTYNSAGIKMEDKYQSSPFTKFFSAYEDNSTPIGYSLNFCGGYLDSNWQPSIIKATLDTVNTCIKQYLPVQLYNFTAVSKQNEVLLSWQTTTEENNNHFDLERSEDGKLFKSIGKIKANTQKIATKSYTFIDKNPNYLNHYRLKQVDNDGKYSYSPLLFVKQENAIPFSILYNYSENQHLKLQISRLSGKGNFVMHNFIGKKILELEAKMGTQFLDVSKLVAGTYLLTLYMENGAAFTKTFIKK